MRVVRDESLQRQLTACDKVKNGMRVFRRKLGGKRDRYLAHEGGREGETYLVSVKSGQDQDAVSVQARNGAVDRFRVPASLAGPVASCFSRFPGRAQNAVPVPPPASFPISLLLFLSSSSLSLSSSSLSLSSHTPSLSLHALLQRLIQVSASVLALVLVLAEEYSVHTYT